MSTSQVVAIIQARMSSTRLPGKILLKLNDKTMLEHVVERVSAASTVNHVIIATSTDPSDDELVEFCHSKLFDVIRGPLHDVLERFLRAAEKTEADIIVRVTSDCPMADPKLIDDVVLKILSGKFDLVANRFPNKPRTLPYGLDVETFTRKALETASGIAGEHEREHVTTVMYADSRFECGLVEYPPSEAAEVHWAVDTPTDFQLMNLLLAGVKSFDWKDAEKLYLDSIG